MGREDGRGEGGTREGEEMKTWRKNGKRKDVGEGARQKVIQP